MRTESPLSRPAASSGASAAAGLGADRVYGIYVHIPFCARRCDYCDFATWTDRDHLIDAYVDACVTDLRRRAAEADLPPATSVFFGGGTPSLLAGAALARILDAMVLAPDAEVTVECNPDRVDAERLHIYADHGVNRISLGVQSMVPHVLRALGRTHERDNVIRTVDLVRDRGFTRLNVDVIYGASGESGDDWLATLDGVLALDPDHVSAYALTVEPGTPLASRVRALEILPPDDDDQADKYLIAEERFAGAGLAWYEISNWARAGESCRHNELYWSQGEYLAIGCAAHGHTVFEGPDAHARRWWNVRTPERYIDAIGQGQSPEAGHERLDEAARREERVTLGLRMATGVRLDWLHAIGADDTELQSLEEAGLIERHEFGRPTERVTLTVSGRLLANEVSARLIAGHRR